jgi:sigma-E factor negative regulatory protein RseC
VTVRPELGLCEGDQVEIALPSRDLLHAAAIVYGLPMLGAMFAAGLAFAMSLGDSAAAFWALGGLAVGLLAARWRLRQAACIGRFAPSVEKRLHELTAAD